MQKIIDLRTTSISSTIDSKITYATNTLKQNLEQQIQGVQQSIPSTPESIGAAPTNHQHTQYLTEHQSLTDYAKLTDIPNTLPASDVYSWAKQETKPIYTYTEVGAAPAVHTHDQYLTEHQNLSNYVTNSTLQNLPAYTITQEDINSWNADISYNDLLDTPEIPSIEGLATEEYVQQYISENVESFSGDYNDLTNTPIIPSNVSELTNDLDFITGSQLSTLTLSSFPNDLNLSTSDIYDFPWYLSQFYNDLVLSPSDISDFPSDLSWFNNDLSYSDFGAAEEYHNHSYSDITDFPTNISWFINDSGYLTSSDIPEWAMQEKKPTYSVNEIENLNYYSIGAAAEEHSHSEYATTSSLEEVSTQVEQALNTIISGENYFSDIISDVEDIVG